MSRRGRPKNPVQSERIVLSGWLHPVYDADILAWWKAIPPGQRMNAFKTALRSGGLTLEQGLGSAEQDEIQSAADDLLSNWEF